MTHQRALPVRTPSFKEPRPEEISPDSVASFVHTSDVPLTQYGITPNAMASAFVWLLTITHLDIPGGVNGLSRFQGLVDPIKELSR